MKEALSRWGGFSWPLVVGAGGFLFAMARGKSILSDGDTYWHIAAGRWIVEHGAIPSADPFSHTLAGAVWTAHEWLAEVIFYFVFQAGGWPGVVVLTGLAFAATLAYLARFLHAYLAPAHVLIFSILALAMASPHLLARPHMLAMPLLLVWSAGIVRACEAGRMPGLWLLGIMTLWANLHGGFTLGIALAAAFGIEAVLLAGDKAEKLVAARRWGVFLLLAIAAGALTPHGLEAYFFAAKVLGMSYALANLNEWSSPDFQKFQFLEVWLMLFIAAALARGIRLSPVRLAILLVLLHLALKHARNVGLLGLLSPLLLAYPLREQWGAPQGPESQTKNLDGFFMRHAQPASAVSVALVFVVLGAIAFHKLGQGAFEPPDKLHPVAAVRAVKEAGIKGPVYNSYMFGGYLVFSGIPVFIDGRADMYGDEFLEQFLEAYRHPHSGDMERMLDKYDVNWTLLQANAPAVEWLDQLPGWQRFYSDKTAVVHVRRAGDHGQP